MHFPYFPGWLDDIGLPQYKDSFSEGSVDGRMLNYLTFVSSEDLSLSNGFSCTVQWPWTCVIILLTFHKYCFAAYVKVQCTYARKCCILQIPNIFPTILGAYYNPVSLFIIFIQFISVKQVDSNFFCAKFM